MRREQIQGIANAVLYEGYLLYPYRHSAIKNRQRWTFGVVYPRKYSEAQGGIEPWTMQTECLVRGQAESEVSVTVRFLHLLLRTTTTSEAERQEPATEPATAATQGAMGWAPDSWEEGVEREVAAPALTLGKLVKQPQRIPIAFPAARMVERSENGAAEIVREQLAIAGTVSIAAEPVATEMAGANLFKLRVRIENTTPETDALPERRDAVLLRSFVSTHTILQAQQGAFVSLLEPPEELSAAAQSCQNQHTWPVLVGDAGETDALLSSPIILYDYPQIAPESAGALFDGTEIDEILTLRILALSDEEKAEIRQGDERAREILERTEALTPEQMMKLHGVLRGLETTGSSGATAPADAAGDIFSGYGPDDTLPIIALVGGRVAQAGDHVRLHPSARADAFDMLLDGKAARIEDIKQDYENRVYLVVTLDDDPGREQPDERVLPGHRFFFFPEEIELLESEGADGEGAL